MTDVDAPEASMLPALMPRPRRAGVDDPSHIGFPPTLPLEIALAEEDQRTIAINYGYDRDSWNKLIQNPVFQKACADAVEQMQREGMTFRAKARMQAEALLETSWKIIHAQGTPPAVKADLIKHTWKVAGVEPKETLAAISPLQININL